MTLCFSNIYDSWSFNIDKDPNDFIEVGGRLSYACHNLRWDVSTPSKRQPSVCLTSARYLNKAGQNHYGPTPLVLASMDTSAPRQRCGMLKSSGSSTLPSTTLTTQYPFLSNENRAAFMSFGGSVNSPTAQEFRQETTRK